MSVALLAQLNVTQRTSGSKLLRQNVSAVPVVPGADFTPVRSAAARGTSGMEVKVALIHFGSWSLLAKAVA